MLLPSATLLRLGELYLFLVAGVAVGAALGRKAPPQASYWLGQAIFWVGAPLTIVVSMYGTDFSGWVWLAPVVAWLTILVGLGLGGFWLHSQRQQAWSKRSQGSFLLAAMAGNTGYLGYPISLFLAGQAHFVWALLFDLLGTAIGTYGLGVVVAARFSDRVWAWQKFCLQILLNPPLWSFGLGLALRYLTITPPLLKGLHGVVWGVIFASLVLAGMRLNQLAVWPNWGKVLPSLTIKMLVLPFLVGWGLTLLGVPGGIRLVLVLQAAMPPAFSSLVIAEVYQLDQELAVTLILLGSIALLLLLPLWLGLFGI